MEALPRKHRHSLNSSTYLGGDVEQICINFAPIENAIEKLALVRRQIEQELSLIHI